MKVLRKEDHVEVILHCIECNKDIIVNIAYSLIEKADRFPFEYLYVHGEPKHGITLYLDKDFQVRGTELLKNVDLNLPEIEETKIIPYKKGKISPMVRSLGMISKKDYEILQMCDGKSSIYDISQKKQISLQEINKIFQKLIDKSLIKTKKMD